VENKAPEREFGLSENYYLGGWQNELPD
jgi:hypothetical protein